MATRYTYTTTIVGTTDAGEPEELEVEVSYAVVWGRPETPPAYDHGGLPADPDEIDDVRLELVNGTKPPHATDEFSQLSVNQEFEAAILQEIAVNERHYFAMIEEAAQHEAAWAE